MPHIPRRSSPTSGVPPELMQPPRSSHAPIPVQAPQRKREAQQDTQAGRRKKIGLGSLNLHTYEPDQKKLLKIMFGKEPDVDENTGQLVLNKPAPAAPAANGNGGQAKAAHAILPMLGRVADPHAHRPPPGFAGPPLRGTDANRGA